MDIKDIKGKLEEYLQTENLKLFDCSYSKGEGIYTVLLDEKLSLDQIEGIAGKISEFMDQYDQDLPPYILDVSTVGAERPIRNEEEIVDAIGSYIFVKTKDKAINGYLRGFENGELKVEYLDKTRKKEAIIKQVEIKEIRYAVSFKGE